MTNEELLARQAGWFPTREAHVLFAEGPKGRVCRHLRVGEHYNEDTDRLYDTAGEEEALAQFARDMEQQ